MKRIISGARVIQEIFIDLAEIFVPGRAEQVSALLDLIPARADERFTIVELASGEGILAQAILERFSRVPLCRARRFRGDAVNI